MLQGEPICEHCFAVGANVGLTVGGIVGFTQRLFMQTLGAQQSVSREQVRFCGGRMQQV